MPPKQHAPKPKVTITKTKGKGKNKHVVKEVVKISGRGDYRPTSLNRRIKGRGDYKSVGSALGGAVGSVADGIHSALKIFGFGDYRTKGPASNSLSHLWDANKFPMKMGAMNVQFAGGPPRVTHREMIMPIVSKGPGFHTEVFRIQPGLKGTHSIFPWGASVAQCFQQYEMHGMIFEYVPTSTNYSSTTALGTVIMSTLYDAESPPLATAQAAYNNEFTTSAPPSDAFIHPIECASKESPVTVRYIRSDNSESAVNSSDVRLDDVGLFQISMNGISAPAGTQIGELWVIYDVLYLKPQLPDLHVGTSFAASGTFDAKNGAVSGVFATFDVHPASSLPVTANQGHRNRLNLPLSYNGSYIAALFFSPANPATPNPGPGYGFSNPWGLSAVGSDVTGLKILRAPATGEPADAVSYSTFVNNSNGNQYVFGGCVLYAFQTIAENADDNWIQFQTSASLEDNPPPGTYTVLITALDNDVQEQDVFQRLALTLYGKNRSRKTDITHQADLLREVLSRTGLAGESSSSPSLLAASSRPDTLEPTPSRPPSLDRELGESGHGTRRDSYEHVRYAYGPCQ